MQVLPAPVNPVATKDRIDLVAMLLVKLIPVSTKVGIGLANVDHLNIVLSKSHNRSHRRPSETRKDGNLKPKIT